jgi:predicted dehydrogenase
MRALSKLRCAVIGCGRVGCGFDDLPNNQLIRTHAKAYFSNVRTDLVALCDIDTKVLHKYGKKYSVKKVYNNYKQMFEMENLDCVSICTLADTHIELVNYAIKNNIKGIIIEKPISDSLSSTKKILDLCKKNNVKLIVNHQRRFFGFYQELSKSIKNKKFGQIQHVNMYYGGGIANTGSHIFDVLRLFFGEVESLISESTKNESHNIHDPNLDVSIKFKNNIICNLIALDSKNYGIAEIEIFGTKNRIHLDLITNKIKYYKMSDKLQDYKRLVETKSPIICSIPSTDIRLTIKNLVDSVERKKKILCNGLDGYYSLELVIASLISNKQKMRIKLPIKNYKNFSI